MNSHDQVMLLSLLLYRDTGFMSVSELRDHAMLNMMYKIKSGMAPDYLTNILPP